MEVKAVAPIRRFNALKELIASSDKLVNELKLKVFRFIPLIMCSQHLEILTIAT